VALEVFAGSGRVRQVLASLTTACVGAVLLIVTVTRNADYRSEVSLWEATSRGSPEKLRVLNNLGVAYMEAGRWDDAQSVFRRAIDIDPGYERARRNLDRAERRRLDDIPGAQMPQ
jgi:Flp pilus assembly protein TadD